MAMQDALGPVFAYEWIRISRRWQLYAIRSAFVATILGALLVVWATCPWNLDEADLQRLALFGGSVNWAVAFTQLMSILLAAPAATAGAVCLDKSRGTLLHVMATDLTDAEIVLGKLAAALAPVLGLVFCMLPVMMLTSLLGGVDPVTLLGTFGVSIGTAVLGCTIAFALSVWGRKTHEVLSATYLILIFWIAGLPTAGTIARRMGFSPFGLFVTALDDAEAMNPFELLTPTYNDPASWHLMRVALFLGGCLVVSTLLVWATIRRIRPVTLHQRVESDDSPKSKWRLLAHLRLPTLLPSPSLDGNPVLWREWSRTRPSRWARVIWFTYFATALLLTSTALTDVLSGGMSESTAVVNMFLVSVGLLLLTVRSATSLSEERTRGSLDVLMSTPMSTRSILIGKWWGTFRLVPYLAILPMLVGAAPCLLSGMWGSLVLFVALILGYGAAVTSTGLAVSIWVVRQSRVLALTVGLYLAACILWVVLAATTFPMSNIGPFVLIGSPLYGPAMTTLGFLDSRPFGPNDLKDGLFIWLLCWNVYYWLLAGILFIVSCSTFDRCLGRATDYGPDDPADRGLRNLLPTFRRQAPEESLASRGASEPA
ncbi:ABC transporter permease subunit [Paludisphaera rhizosphaerae]|uniref:ABC transporter permease subunit n=1 Tax=Paludisphaera rhizosphaerae TaxID=2711216 RepID=UPI0013E9D318|nr:ABC transporter permease subunit [Paludisphaera rhizosphaerae]